MTAIFWDILFAGTVRHCSVHVRERNTTKLLRQEVALHMIRNISNISNLPSTTTLLPSTPILLSILSFAIEIFPVVRWGGLPDCHPPGHYLIMSVV